MTNNKSVHINKWLLPVSWLYGFVVWVRNKLFDIGLLKRKSFDLPIICIGNITVGGTGKTPHTEYIVNLLKDKYRVGVLSRGYGRKSNGFLLADSLSTSEQIGDEPYQIKQKYPSIIVAVDEKRVHGIETLLKLQNPPQVIILDDAFQHRYVSASLNILLTDFNRLFYEDKLLPAGRLREQKYHASEADILLVTKYPQKTVKSEFETIQDHLSCYVERDKIYFTTFTYLNLISVFDNQSIKLDSIKDISVLLVTGIASPTPLVNEIKKYTSSVDIKTYPDHYQFRPSDIANISTIFEEISATEKIIITTEKDVSRFRVVDNEIADCIKKHMFYLPISVNFEDENHKLSFDQKIINHVRKN